MIKQAASSEDFEHAQICSRAIAHFCTCNIPFAASASAEVRFWCLACTPFHNQLLSMLRMHAQKVYAQLPQPVCRDISSEQPCCTMQPSENQKQIRWVFMGGLACSSGQPV